MFAWILFVFFFFKQKTAYEMRISDWSSDVCSSDLMLQHGQAALAVAARAEQRGDRRRRRRVVAEDEQLRIGLDVGMQERKRPAVQREAVDLGERPSNPGGR